MVGTLKKFFLLCWMNILFTLGSYMCPRAVELLLLQVNEEEDDNEAYNHHNNNSSAGFLGVVSRVLLPERQSQWSTQIFSPARCVALFTKNNNCWTNCCDLSTSLHRFPFAYRYIEHGKLLNVSC